MSADSRTQQEVQDELRALTAERDHFKAKWLEADKKVDELLRSLPYDLENDMWTIGDHITVDDREKIVMMKEALKAKCDNGDFEDVFEDLESTLLRMSRNEMNELCGLQTKMSWFMEGHKRTGAATPKCVVSLQEYLERRIYKLYTALEDEDQDEDESRVNDDFPERLMKNMEVALGGDQSRVGGGEVDDGCVGGGVIDTGRIAGDGCGDSKSL